MFRMGLTGGIASGKSLVSDTLDRLGAVVIDADVLARQVVEPGSTALREIVERFGEGILLPGGCLDRPRLGELVFGDPAARSDLNRIIHPRVRAAAASVETGSAPDAVVVHVIPLLVETGQQDDFDAVLVVDVPEEVQVARLMKRSALTREQAWARLEAQASRQERLAAADWVVENTGGMDATRRAVHELWRGPIAGLRRELTATAGDA